MSITTTHPHPARSRAALPPALDPASTQLGFGLFLLCVFLLYVRPMEYVDDIVGAQAFLGAGLVCFLVSFPAVLVLADPRHLSRPLVALPLLLWPFVVASNLAARPELAAEGFVEYAKVLVFYFLLLGLTTTPGRLRTLLFCLPWFAAVIVVIAILQYHGVIDLALFKQLRENTTLRLRATGLFRDPNDLGVLIAVALACCTYFVAYPRFGLHSLVWLALIGLFLYALRLTHSRGAMLAVGGVLFVLVRARVGTFTAVVLAVLALPSLLLFSGRAVDLSGRHDTGATRLWLWSDSLVAFASSPIFGVGWNNLQFEIGQVAHNSYLHALAELGFFGGSIFLGMWLWALWSLLTLQSGKRVVADPELRGLHTTVLAVLVAYMIGMVSLTLCYIMTSFFVLGLAATYLEMAKTTPPTPRTTLSDRFFLWMGLMGVLFWGGMKILIPVLSRLSG